MTVARLPGRVTGGSTGPVFAKLAGIGHAPRLVRVRGRVR